MADVCEKAGIPLITVEAKRNYQPEVIKLLLKEKLDLVSESERISVGNTVSSI